MRYTIARIASGIVSFMLAVVGSLLGLRFILKLFSANADNGFVNWIYETSGEILAPFRGIFTPANLDGFVIEFTTLFALVVYSLIGLLAFYLIDILAPTEETNTARKKK